MSEAKSRMGATIYIIPDKDEGVEYSFHAKNVEVDMSREVMRVPEEEWNEAFEAFAGGPATIVIHCAECTPVTETPNADYDQQVSDYIHGDSDAPPEIDMRDKEGASPHEDQPDNATRTFALPDIPPDDEEHDDWNDPDVTEALAEARGIEPSKSDTQEFFRSEHPDDCDCVHCIMPF